MRLRDLGAALAAALIGFGGFVAPAVAGASLPAPTKAATAPTKPATTPMSALDGAGWLGRQFRLNGDLPVSDGEAGLDNLSLGLVALVSTETGEVPAHRGLGYLEKHFGSYVSIADGEKPIVSPGRLAQVMLAAEAMKASVVRFGGTTRADDLLARLLATQAKTGGDAGLFGSPDGPTYSSAYTQGLALLALAAAGHPNTAGARWLVAQQCSDGGWTSYRSSLRTPCPKEDPTDYAGADTNSTALAVEALVATHVSPRVNPLKFLQRSQYPDGGFGYFGTVSRAQPVDPDSTALVVQALVALHELGNPAFRKSAASTPRKALAHFQLGCSAPASERGAYTFPGVPGPNLIATLEAIPAAAGKAFPIRPATQTRTLPIMRCPSRNAPSGRPERSTTGSHRAGGTTEKACPSVPKAHKGQVVVPIVVDFGTGAAEITVTCVAVPDGSNGSDVLQARAALLRAAQPVYASSGLLCSIDGYPSGGCGTATNGHYAYWAYFHGGSKWTYANDGPAENVVSKGDVEGWRFQPDGTATAADPPPRAPSNAGVLESAGTPATTTTTTSTTTTSAPTTDTSRPRAASTTTSTLARSPGTTTTPGGGGHGGTSRPGSAGVSPGTVAGGSGSSKIVASGTVTSPRSRATTDVARDALLALVAAIVLAGTGYAVVRSRRSLGAE